MMLPSVWNSPGIIALIESLVECSGMSAALYDGEGQLVVRKFSRSKLIQYLLSVPNEKFLRSIELTEAEFISDFLKNNEVKSISLLNRLDLYVLPLRLLGGIEGYVVVGYIFSRFPSQEDCEVFAKEFGANYHTVWKHARNDQLSTQEKLDKFAFLFKVVLESHLNAEVSGLQLMAADRMKDDLLSIVSHELRTPLTAGVMRLQMLQRRMKTGIPSDIRSQIDQALSSFKTQENIINDLLDVAKISQGELKYNIGSGNLSQLVFSCYREMQLLIEQKGLRFNLDVAPVDVEYDFDENRMKQVVLNLLNNAYKFTDHGSISLKLTQEKDHVQLTVSDTGVGLTKEEAEKIFYKFVQSSKSGNVKGLGLGLFLADQIVRVHRGRITARSEGLALGSTFTVELPNILAKVIVLIGPSPH